MNKKSLFLLLLICVFFNSIKADEGMWLPLLLKQLNEADMQSKGLLLTAEDIYSINKSSLKDAVVLFGGGCTAEIISPQGLLLTNHHCGFGQIQSHSSVEHDYLTDGFWAMNEEAELPCTGLTVSLIVKMEDVTDDVLKGINNNLSLEQKNAILDSNITQIKKEAVRKTHFDAIVKPFFYGNKYYLFITETFKDIRLVVAPPSAIGKFGGDTDNWMWPRHNADFSLFRIYADKTNKPAAYSKDNVPYRPKYHLPISLNGINKADFTMVYGFPARTSEYLTSFSVDYIQNTSNPARIKMRDKSLQILEEEMQKNDVVRIKYAAKQARISNYYKKWMGENKGLQRINAVEIKKQRENIFAQMVNRLSDKKGYDTLLTAFQNLYKEFTKYDIAEVYFSELVYYGPEIIRYANQYKALVELLLEGNASPAATDSLKEVLINTSKKHFKDYDPNVDKLLFSALIPVYFANTDKTFQSDILTKNKKDFSKYANELYSTSLLADEQKANELLADFSASTAKKLTKDPAYVLMEQLYRIRNENILPEYKRLENSISSVYKQYVKAMILDIPAIEGKKYYPDANGTLRITYGQIDGYQPRDGVLYDYYTTLDGMMEKEDSSSSEFFIPKKLKELYQKKDYGLYAQDNKMMLCFIATNHTTGGNSGSPVINAQGQLIGLNFDRNWEGTMSDIMYDPDRCRNIAVDIRYILFIIDKYAGAKHLIKEMSILTKEDEYGYRLKQLNKIIDDYPDTADTYNQRGLVYLEMKEYENALSDFTLASALQQKNPEYFYNKAHVEAKLQHFEKAINDFTTVIKLQKNNKLGYFYRGIMYAEQKDFAKAILDFNQTILLDPQFAKAYYNRGNCNIILKKKIEACEDYKQAIALGDEKAKSLYEKSCE